MNDLREEARTGGLLEKAEQRLQRIAGGLLAEQTCLDELFAPLSTLSAAYPGSLASALFEDPLSTTVYSEHLFRDWVWGEAENSRIRALVEQHLTEPTLALAVFGAGTARLALDLSRHALVSEVLAIDTNPLPFLVADRLLSGSAVDLVEFPLIPLSVEHVAIPRRIEPPPPAPHVHLVLADAMRAPFPDGALDVVVTPWFIDAVAADILEVASAVNRVLRPGGLWINVGPLCYSGSASKAYSFDEICDFVRGSAFDLQSCEQHSLAYFDSPVSGTCRTDRTYVFAARKIGEPPVSVTPPKSTPWLDDLTQPIPLSAVMTESLQRSVMTAGIASLVDGTRSANDIATILSQSWNVEPRALILPIRAFLRSVVAA